jgi:2-desacetyl-2-hydroxyethyl bacteriochlorophyllide A dehydrogenase
VRWQTRAVADAGWPMHEQATIIMKALFCIQPGELQYKEIDAPLAQTGEAIIKIRRVGICGTDLHAFEGSQPFFEYPRILGHELSGDLVDFDKAAGFVPGEAVTVLPYFHCGTCIACRCGRTNACTTLRVCGVHIDGGMVEYLRVPSSSLVHGGGLSYDALAMVEPLAIGAHAVRRAAIQPGEFVLVVGAGAIGLGTMEMVRLAEGRVIAMDVNEERLSFCRNQLHILHTINPGAASSSSAFPTATADDAMAQLRHLTRGDMPTVVIDATGNRKAINDGFQYMAHGARYVLVGLQKGNIEFSHPAFHKKEATLMSSRNATREDFVKVMDAIERKYIDPTAFITHRTSFEKAGEAFPGWLDPANGVIKPMVEIG